MIAGKGTITKAANVTEYGELETKNTRISNARIAIITAQIAFLLIRRFCLVSAFGTS